MSGTLIIPPLGLTACEPATPAPVTASDSIAHDGWLPGVDLARVRAEARLRESVTPERLRDAVLGAMIWVGEQLAEWQAGHVAAGRAALDQVPGSTIAGEPRLVILYRQAVTAQAKALLVERYRDVDLTAAGERKVEELVDSARELRRDAIHAVRAMLGVTRTAVELI